MNRARASRGLRGLLLAWLAVGGALCGQELAWRDGRGGGTAAKPGPAVVANGVRPAAMTGGGMAGLVVEVELMEAGRLPTTQAVEVRWQEISGVSAWWLLSATPLLMVFFVRGSKRRGLRAGARLR